MLISNYNKIAIAWKWKKKDLIVGTCFIFVLLKTPFVKLLFHLDNLIINKEQGEHGCVLKARTDDITPVYITSYH